MKQKTKPTFVALDGETIDDKYCLLGTNIEGKTLENKNGIKTIEALRWLYNLGNNRHYRERSSVFVSFFFSYDVEMFLRDLPKRKKLFLFKTGKVDYQDYSLRYYKRKFFTVKRRSGTRLKDGSGNEKVSTNGITIFDVCGFFIGQGGFIKVLQSFGIPVPQEIIEGKAGRSTFTWEDYEEIKKYNRLECILLVELMEKIYALCERVNLIPRRWYGSSALANLALRLWGVSEFSRRTSSEYTPETFFDVITRAYFGGRIEAFKLGSFNNIYAYDINSAYPSAMIHLPATKGNYWIESDKYQKGFGVWRVKYKFPKSETIGFFPYRMRDGSIKFPLRGEGYYWSPEVELARKIYPKCLEITHGYYLLDETVKTPLAEYIPKLYRERQAYKAKGDLSQWILKIVLNSLYGKFAQKVGRADFKNFVYAGFITSYTRAQMRAAVVGKERDIIAFNTDGIFSKSKLPRIRKISTNLGEWELKEYKKLTVLMSGLYFTDDGKGKKVIKNRGYAGLPEWDSLIAQLNKTGKVKVEISTFVGFLLAFNFPNVFSEHYLKFLQRDKNINPRSPTKRRYAVSDIVDWSKDSCESRPVERVDGLSHPIKLVAELTEEDLYDLVDE